MNMMSRFRIRVVYQDGHILRAIVTRASLRGFRLSAVRGASVKVVKLKEQQQ